MKKIIKRTVVAALAALTAVTLTACTNLVSSLLGSGEDAAAKNLIVIVSPCQNTLKANTDVVEDTFTERLKNGGTISVVVCDGKPYHVGDVSLPEQNIDLPESQMEQYAAAYAADAVDLLNNSAEARTAETDPLAAFSLASRIAASTEGESEIYAYMTGISTASDFDMTQLSNGIMAINVDTTVENLNENGYIADLNGIPVTFIGMGDVNTAYQDALTKNNVTKLKELWGAITEKAGGTATFDESLSESEGYDTTIPTSSVSVVLNPTEISEDTPPTVVKFSEDVLAFVSNEAVLLNENEARKALQTTAEYMEAHPDFSVVLMGTTATGKSQDACLELSKARAETVESVLCELGVSKTQITTVGKGYQDPYHTEDLRNGELIEELAAQNRAVYLLSQSEAAELGII